MPTLNSVFLQMYISSFLPFQVIIVIFCYVQTCVDLENKTDHNDTRNSNDYKVNTTCNESDLTEDISELDTQPIIPFRDDDEENADKKEEDSSTKKDPAAEQEEDDEWQLKFSETQTQDLLNLEKYEEENNGITFYHNYNNNNSIYFLFINNICFV